MLEAKYYRDYKHNYMILQCGQTESSRSYQYKILTSGKIDEILRCSVRHMNGATYYYYDISSRATLDSLYRDKKMTCTQVKDVLWQLHGICSRLSGYFMDEAGLVLLPEHIYYDLTAQKYVGLYYPDYEAAGAETYRPLMDFLLEHIDTEDQRLTEDMYRIYEMAEEPYFSLEDALQIMEEGVWPEPGPAVISTSALCMEEDLRMEPPAAMQPERRAGKSPKRSPFYLIFALLSVCGIAGALTVYYLYELTKEEEMMLYGSVAALGVSAAICLTGFFRSGRQKSANRSDGERGLIPEAAPEPGGYPAADSFPEAEPCSLSDVISRDRNPEPAAYRSVDHRAAAYRAAGNRDASFGTAVADRMQDDGGYGNTVFFDASKIEECKLYAVDKKNKKHIELKQFPCTIGKMAGCVDHVLADDSVSRIHARFDREGEKLLLTDMNSTNGTYKNGLRMQPKETVEIEPGDEVRFGNLNYCYR